MGGDEGHRNELTAYGVGREWEGMRGIGMNGQLMVLEGNRRG